MWMCCRYTYSLRKASLRSWLAATRAMISSAVKGSFAASDGLSCAKDATAISRKPTRRGIRIDRELPLTLRIDRRESSRLVDHLQRELDLPRGSRGLTDNPEAAAAQDIRRQPKIDDIEDVEEFRAKLEGTELPIPTMPERGVFDQRDIEIVVSRSAEGVATQRAKAPLIRARSARDINRNVKE